MMIPFLLEIPLATGTNNRIVTIPATPGQPIWIIKRTVIPMIEIGKAIRFISVPKRNSMTLISLARRLMSFPSCSDFMT